MNRTLLVSVVLVFLLTGLTKANTSTPLHVAATNGDIDTVRQLIKQGADVNAKNRNGLTPLHLVAVPGYTEIARILIENGADVNAKTKNIPPTTRRKSLTY